MGEQQAAGDLRVGAPVFCRDGEKLGHVKALRAAHFKVNAPLQPDYWLRRDTVAGVTAEGVMLSVAKDHVGAAQVGDPDLDAGPPPAAAAPADYAPAAAVPDYVPETHSEPRGQLPAGGAS